MFGFKISAIITFVLVLITIGGVLFGATWFSLLTGLTAIFSALWWMGTMEKEGKLW